MEKLPLEWLLEGGLYVLGVPLNKRVYHEDFVEGAKIDDILREESIESNRKKFKAAKAPEEFLYHFLGLGLSEFQREIDWGLEPFFRRVSGEYNGKNLIYDVHSHSSEKVDGYRTHADRLIKERKIDMEVLNIRDSEGLLLALTLSHEPESTINVSVVAEELAEKNKEAIKSLNGEKYDPQKVYEKVLDVYLLNDFSD